MTYPSGTPVDELVLENIRATLAAVAAPSFHYTLKSVSRLQDLSTKQVVEFPAAFIGTPRYVWSDKINPLYSATMEVTVRAFVEDIVSFSTSLSWLGADVRQALLADVTRGGVAVDTKITAQEPFMSVEGDGPSNAVDLTVQVRFRHLFTDPNHAQ